ncbi:hypothetical protein D3C85_1066780 [compost metagenome]
MGCEHRSTRRRFAAHQAIAGADLLVRARDFKCGDTTLFADPSGITDGIGIDAKQLLSGRVNVGFTLTKDAVSHFSRREWTASKNPIAHATEHSLIVAGNDVGRRLERFSVV